MGRLRFPYRVPLPGVHIECGPDTPPELRRQIEMERAATPLPIPFRPAPSASLEASLRELALAFQDRYGRRLRSGDRP